MFNLKIKGGKRLARKIEKLEKKVGNKVMRDSVKESMEPVAAEAKRLAPIRSGRLRRSIRVASSSRRGKINGLVRTGTRKQLKIPASDPYYYPAAHEYGTRKMPARSFLRAALGNKRRAVIKSLSSIIQRNLMKAIR